MTFFFGINRSINANIAVIINITVTIVTTIIALCCLRSFIPKELSHIEPHFNTYSWVRISLVLSLVTGFNLIMQQTDILMIGALHNTTDSGIYTVAQRVANLLKFGSLAINAIATPLIAETYAANKMDQLQYLATLATRRISVFTILSCLPLIFWGDKVLSLFGSDFQSAYPVLIVLTFGQIANAFAGPVGVIMTMTNNQKYALYITISSAFLNVLLNYVLIKSYGIIGAAIATSITLAFWNITQAFMVWRRLGVNSTIFARSWIRGFFS
jgi:O-antigen/teichoic acid export membrane protein